LFHSLTSHTKQLINSLPYFNITNIPVSKLESIIKLEQKIDDFIKFDINITLIPFE